MANICINESQILFTVVVSIFNIEKFVPQCIESIIHQTYRNLDIILIDDGSTDSSGKICDEYATRDKRIRVIHKSNAGLGEARNTGLFFAKGQYITFFDGDDFADTDLFEKVALHLNRYKDVEILDFDIGYFNGEIIYNKYRRSEVCHYTEKNSIQKDLYPNMIYNKNNRLCLYNCTWNKVYKVRFLKDIKFQFMSEREFISEDCYANLFLYSKVNNVLLIPDILYFYRYNNNSLTHKFNPERFNRNVFQFNQSIRRANCYYDPKRLYPLIGLQILINLESHFKQLVFKNKIHEFKKEFNSEDFRKIIRTIQKVDLPCFQKLILFMCKFRLFWSLVLIFKLRLSISERRKA